MVLTLEPRTPLDPDKFPTFQLLILALCRLAEPIALTSCSPYAWVMVKGFHLGDDKNASFYAGLFFSAFSFFESLTGVFWGSLSDRIGRKPVLLLGCGGTLLSMLIVGFAPNFWIAVLGRALGGLLNGNIGVIQTMVGELVHKPKHEPRAYAVMPFVWSLGTIIGPAIGGFFANPTASLPSLFSQSGLFGVFPYLLPNLICAILLLMSIVFGYFLLVETHPVSESMDQFSIGVGKRGYGTFHADNTCETKQWSHSKDSSSWMIKFNIRSQAFTPRVVGLVVALGIFTYHSMTYDYLLPIFFQDDRRKSISTLDINMARISGGLGMTTQKVGFILSVNGVIALFVQAAMFPLFASRLGVWKLLVLVTIIHPLNYMVVPFLTMLPNGLVCPGIWTCLTIRNFTSILAYPLLLILLKEASPVPSVLGKINGVAASAGAACRCIAPPIAGYLYSLGARQGFSGLAWCGSSFIAFIGVFQIFWIDREKSRTTPGLAAPMLENAKKDIVRVERSEVEV